MINTAFQNGEEQILLSQLNKDSEVPAAAAEHSRNQVMDASLKKKKKEKEKHRAHAQAQQARAQVRLINHGDRK